VWDNAIPALLLRGTSNTRGKSMNSRSGKLLLACFTLAAVAGLSACASNNSVKARALKSGASATALEECQNLTVVGFTVPSGRDAAIGTAFAQSVETRLSNDFGPLFSSVEMGTAARGLDHECVITGAITKYKPGSRVARFIIMGLGHASLEGTVTVTDGASGNSLMSAPFDKLWAWGGITGASKGMKQMETEASAQIAATVARAKGWSPAGAK
jgi:hypothetical protein